MKCAAGRAPRAWGPAPGASERPGRRRPLRGAAEGMRTAEGRGWAPAPGGGSPAASCRRDPASSGYEASIGWNGGGTGAEWMFLCLPTVKRASRWGAALERARCAYDWY